MNPALRGLNRRQPPERPRWALGDTDGVSVESWPMRRRLLNLLTAMALLLCVAVGLLAARSYVKADAIGYKAGHGVRRLYGIISSNGVVAVFWGHPSEN